MAHTIYIRGIPENKQIVDVRVRQSPGTNTETLFRAAVGLTATCDKIENDPVSEQFNGQVYRWFHLVFPDGRHGWVRDDLLDIEGDLTIFGLSNYVSRTFAFLALPSAKAATITPASTPSVTVSVTTPSADSPAPAAATTVNVTVTPSVESANTPTTVTVSVTPSVPSVPMPTGCSGQIRLDTPARIRALPSVNAQTLGSMNPGQHFHIDEMVAGQDGRNYRWAKTLFNGVAAYVREDLVILGDDCAKLGMTSAVAVPASAPAVPATTGTLNQKQLLDSPLKVRYRVFQEFGDKKFGDAHKGIDLTTPNGGPSVQDAPIINSTKGTAYLVVPCTRCTKEKPNFDSQGVKLWDSAAIRDIGWGYGFGNHIVMRYAWEDLPVNMRNEMTRQKLAGGYAYVVYAHLSRIDVTQDATVPEGAQLGLLGNTGNSTGEHLHLEVHISLEEKEQYYFQRIAVDPRLMYTL
jgi:hypothetical protein